jgi:lipid-binding SYLF domain-containing protein
MTVKPMGKTNPGAYPNRGLNNPPAGTDPAAMGPSAQPQDNDTSAHRQYDKGAKAADAKTVREYERRAEKAGEVLESLANAGDNSIPDSLLGRAEGIAVIPGMVKGAFGIGGRYGKGLLSQRTADGRWSAPAFVQIGGGSFGFQLGLNETDLVLIFTDRNALDSLEKGMSLKLGVDAGVSAGPVGRSAEAGISQNAKGGIFAYSRSKGLFAGIALDGAVVDVDKTANRHVYGENVDVAQLLRSSAMASNPNVRPFMNALDHVAAMKRTTER